MQHSRGELTNALSIRHLWDSSGTLDDAIDPTAHDLLAVDFARPTAGHHSRGRKRDLRRDVTFRRLYARRPSRPQAAACPCLSPHAPTAIRLRLAPSVAGSPSGCPDARNSAGDCRLARRASVSVQAPETPRSGRRTEAALGGTRRNRCIGTSSARASSPSEGARAPSLSQGGTSSGGAGRRRRTAV